MTPDQEYAELLGSLYEVGWAHGASGDTLSDMMTSVERAVERPLPVNVWLELFAGYEAGVRDQLIAVATSSESPGINEDIPF